MPPPLGTAPQPHPETERPFPRAAQHERRDGGAALNDAYREIAARILEASLKSDEAWAKLSYLTDQVGHRLSGSADLARAVSWAEGTFSRDGHEGVRLEKVHVPHWVRGVETASIETPRREPLSILGLGGTVGTPPGGVSGEVVVVRSFGELDELGPEKVRGKIVLFDHPMRTNLPFGPAYGEALPFRSMGASHAAPLGATAVLVRSLTTKSLGTPHTGSMRYADGVKKIPAASISVEGADLVARLVASGQKVKVRLELGAKTLPDADSANVVAEIKGREKPEEIVLLGAHLDSWDIGQGANDDGTGCAIVMEALSVLRKLGLSPKRTVRAVLFTNEENGVRGAKAYAEAHKDELRLHVAAIESDTGSGPPLGLYSDGDPPWRARVETMTSLLTPIGANHVEPGFPGEDVLVLKSAGAALFGMAFDDPWYFDYHHSAADTLDKVNPEDLKKDVATMATMAFVLADMERKDHRVTGALASTEPGARRPSPALTPAVLAETKGAARLTPLDQMRGLVMVLMAIDHSSGAFNAGRLFTDAAFLYTPGTPLPAAQFFTRWITHLCAPTFVFLAGTGLAFNVEKRVKAGASAWSIDRYVLTRGLVIAAFEIWISLCRHAEGQMAPPSALRDRSLFHAHGPAPAALRGQSACSRHSSSRAASNT